MFILFRFHVLTRILQVAFLMVSPTLLAMPIDWLRLGLVVRLPVVADDWGYTDIDTSKR